MSDGLATLIHAFACSFWKFEARKSKSETISNVQNEKFKTFWSFEHSDFGFVSSFDIRILNLSRPWSGYNEFPGDYTDGETPDPIPNSEAKPVRPMVVLTGESRSSPGIIKAGFRKKPAFSFWFGTGGWLLAPPSCPFTFFSTQVDAATRCFKDHCSGP